MVRNYPLLTGQLQVASMDVDGKRFLNQLNRDYKLEGSIGFLDASSNPLEWSTGNTYDVACGHSWVRRKRCVLSAEAESVHLVVVNRQRS